MGELTYILKGLASFAAKYWMMKCLKSMISAMVILLLIMAIRRVNRGRNVSVNYYSMLLVLPMVFMGMSRLFYQGYMLYVSYVTYEIGSSRIGYVYFPIMAVLLSAYISRSICHRRRLKHMPCRGKVPEYLTDMVAYNELQRMYLRRVRIYLTTADISPYAGGVISPYIVLPATTERELTADELDLILCHELVHIRMGHIICKLWFDLCVIYWWVNPLFIICREILTADMEMMCDEECVLITGMSEKEYAALMLDMAELTGRRAHAQAVFFARRGDYALMKKRITHLSRLIEKREIPRGKYLGIVACVFAAAITLTILITSYPKWTPMDELIMYDEEIAEQIASTDELEKIVSIHDGLVTIDDEEAFTNLIEERDADAEYVLLSYGGIMKLPGAGGCGQVALIHPSDLSEIEYLAADNAVNRMMEIILKLM